MNLLTGASLLALAKSIYYANALLFRVTNGVKQAIASMLDNLSCLFYKYLYNCD